MIFWYHMFGTNIGKLSVQLQLQNGHHQFCGNSLETKDGTG